MTNFSSLDIEQVLYLHDRIINQVGGVQGIGDLALLHSGLERCKATYAGEDLYPNIYKKAAALLHSLIMNHAFVDGNKRTAYESTKRFLYVNYLRITADNDEIIHLCLAVGNEDMEVGQISEWVEENTIIA